MDGPTVLTTRHSSALAEIVLNRPEKLNAINLDWVNDLGRAVDSLAEDPDLEVVVVRGEGRAFCAGLDLDMMGAAGMPPKFFPGQEAAFTALERLPAIVVALIHGYCLGGGLQLALACDIRIASTDSLLGLPAALEGFPPGISPWRLARFVGAGRAMRLSLLGEHVPAAEAEQIGLVDHVLPEERFLEAGRALAERYTDTPHRAAVATKYMIRGAFDIDLDTAFRISRDAITDSRGGEDVAEARRKWAARRAAKRAGTGPA